MEQKEFFIEFGKALYHIDAIYADFSKKSNVSPTLLWILYALNDGKVHTQKDLCYDWSLPKSTVNTLISELKNNDYITLNPIKGKRREMTILLTSKGKSYADSVLENIYQKEKKVFDTFKNQASILLEKLTFLENLLKQ